MTEEQIETQKAKDTELEIEFQNSKKDFWLFLIFIDIIAICVFGFFAYTSFFESTKSKDTTDAHVKPFMEEIIVEDIKRDVTPETSQSPSQPAKNSNDKQEELQQKSKPQLQIPSEKPAGEPAEQKRESIVISGSGKTRTVTFKYFKNAKTVSVVGGFTMRKPVAMKKAGDEWRASLIIYPGEYRYMYIIDGKEMPDPNSEQSNGKSILIVK
ncbi:MAG: hypothetical protein LBG46_06035 [Elusimicrobiota bacterium]|jgi:hypothetical protein|nr:hypothetical protein [Elusimicrobiota bacterium]